ncbi:hypothetical protein B6A27_12965 [Anoxybacillus sp. UARK-01]|nr:hypothetical protein B6A27_12965 [Anoxybacillus sp. UARK-01]
MVGRDKFRWAITPIFAIFDRSCSLFAGYMGCLEKKRAKTKHFFMHKISKYESTRIVGYQAIKSPKGTLRTIFVVEQRSFYVQALG